MNIRPAMQDVLWLLTVVLCLSAVQGCSDSGLEKRIQDTLQGAEVFLKEEGPKYSWSDRERARMVSQALRKTPKTDLRKKPVLAGSIGLPLKNTNGLCVAVFWIEDQPTVNVVQFSSVRLGKSIVKPISPAYQAENRECAKNTVCYRAVFTWSSTEIPAVIAEADCAVCLLRREKIVSEAASIVYKTVTDNGSTHQK